MPDVSYKILDLKDSGIQGGEGTRIRGFKVSRVRGKAWRGPSLEPLAPEPSAIAKVDIQVQDQGGLLEFLQEYNRISALIGLF
jgi:hypothetical protein